MAFTLGSLDHWLFAGLAIRDPSGITLFLLAALASWPAYVIPSLLLGLWWLGGAADRHAAVLASLAAGVALAGAGLLSTLIDTPRPFMTGAAANLLDHASDSSFPSDHATLFFALAAAFLLEPPPSVPRLGAVLAVTGLAVGWARVALGVHFPFDIAGAACLATVAVALLRVTPLRRAAALAVAIGEVVHRRLPQALRSWPRPATTIDDDAHSAR